MKRTAFLTLVVFTFVFHAASAGAGRYYSLKGLVIGGGFGFASGPVGARGGDDFTGLGGYVFVGRELGGRVTLGGKFEGYIDGDAPYGYSYGNRIDQALYGVGFMCRFYPASGYGLRPYAGGDVGMYVRVNREDGTSDDGYDSGVEPGVTGRAGLEVMVINSLAVDFGLSYSVDANEENRLETMAGYVGAVVYF